MSIKPERIMISSSRVYWMEGVIVIMSAVVVL